MKHRIYKNCSRKGRQFIPTGSWNSYEAAEKAMKAGTQQFNISDCYSLSDNGGTPAEGITMLAEDALKSETSFASFNFETVWTFDNSYGYLYPQLIDNLIAQ